MYDLEMYADKPVATDSETALPTFFLFSGPNYYPGGGLDDFASAHTSLEDAEEAMTETLKREDWAHIATLDATEGLLIVKRATRDD